jgi:hypothetical protein
MLGREVAEVVVVVDVRAVAVAVVLAPAAEVPEAVQVAAVPAALRERRP